jgi:hypothetical protein
MLGWLVQPIYLRISITLCYVQILRPVLFVISNIIVLCLI